MSFYYVAISAFMFISCSSRLYAEELDSQISHGKCEPITISMCKGLSYNETVYPNLMNQDNQEEADLEIHQFWPLVEIKCSPDLKPFLCGVYAPACMALGKSLPPCRSVCERAKMGCEGLMKQYGFEWPEQMECTKYPEYRGNGSCIGTAATTTPKTSKIHTQTIKRKPRFFQSQHSEEMFSTTTIPLCITSPAE